MSSWEKLGKIYEHDGSNKSPKLLSHAANPLPVHLEGDIYRVYYSCRDINNHSSVTAVDINIVNHQIIKEYEDPFFEPGPEKSFYEAGVSIGNCYNSNGIKYMLFMGWQNPENSHWRGDIGRLRVTQNGLLELANSKPIMSSNEIDPISLSYPWVMDDTNGGYHMWYGSTQSWDSKNDEMIHTIKYAHSNDGENWTRHGNAIPFELGHAQAFSRPTVAKLEDQYSMWFSYRSGRGEKYRIGRAISHDLENWELALEKTGITVSDKGWDSEMIEYPYVFHHENQLYMLYNGNGYGKTGFGLAIWREEK